MPRENSGVASAARVVVGLGNPYRSDDGVGVEVLRRLSPRPGLAILESAKSGMNLAWVLSGYEKALVVDAAPFLPPGEVALFPLAALPEEGRWGHAIGLRQAAQSLEGLGLGTVEVAVLGIGIPCDPPFGQGLSPKVEEAVPKALEVIEEWLRS